MKVGLEKRYGEGFFTNSEVFDSETKEFIELAQKYPDKAVKFKQYHNYIFVYETVLENRKWIIAFGGDAESIDRLGLYDREKLHQIVRSNLISARKVLE